MTMTKKMFVKEIRLERPMGEAMSYVPEMDDSFWRHVSNPVVQVELNVRPEPISR